MLSFCLFAFPLMGNTEWGGNPVCWWLGLYFVWGILHMVLLVVGWRWVFFTVVSFVWVLTIWYPLGLFLWKRQWHPLQYSCLEDPMDGGAWWAAVHGVVKSQTRLSDFTRTFHFHALEKEMATHSSVLAWKIPGTAEPGGLPSMGSHRVGHDWHDLAAAAELVLW